MGACMSSEKDDGFFSRRTPEEKEQRRVELKYGLKIPASTFLAPGGDDNITISLCVSGSDSQQIVRRDDCAFLLKLRLHENPPDGTIIPPPSISRLIFAEVELDNLSTYRQLDIEDGATLSLVPTDADTLHVTFDDEQTGNVEIPCVLWKQELTSAALTRVTAGKSQCTAWQIKRVLQQGLLATTQQTKSIHESGLQDGDTLVPRTTLLFHKSQDCVGGRNNYDGAVGFSFTATCDFTVLALGRNDNPSIRTPVLVTFWKMGLSRLPSVTWDCARKVGPSSEREAGYLFEAVDEFLVNRGDQCRLSQRCTNGMDLWYDASRSDAQMDSEPATQFAKDFTGAYTHGSGCPLYSDGKNRRAGMLNLRIRPGNVDTGLYEPLPHASVCG